MRIIGILAGLVLVTGFVASASAQQYKPPAMLDVLKAKTVCEAALVNFENTRLGRDELRATAPEQRIKPKGAYTGTKDAYLFAIDGFREHGDVRANCAPDKWPEWVTPAGVKRLIDQGVKEKPKLFCGDAAAPGPSAVALIQARLANAEVRFFEDRILELNNQLDTIDGKHDTIARHLSDADFLRDVAKELAAVCKPNDEALKALALTESAGKAANENAAFQACVKARGGWKPAMDSFAESAKTNEVAKMEEALTKIEVAAKGVNQTCAASEEGLKENDYIVAARKMQILFLQVDGCRDAALAMNQQRQAMNTMAKDQLPAAITQMREAGKIAGKACRNDPSPETWASFVAWITERNLTRIADTPAQ
jgi:hypothetical protein